jgi:DHA2 family multidrug resistance protein-like MFS transporter
MALLLAVGPRVLPEYRDPKPGRFDLPSAVLSLVAVLAVVYGLKQIAEDGGGWRAALSIAAGCSIGVVFVLRQRAPADPLIELRLFRAPAFSVSLAATTLALFAIIGMDLFVAQYLQLVLGMGPFEAGLWLLDSAGGILVGATLASLLGRRVRARSALAGGLALGAVGSGLLTQVEGSSLALLVAGSVVMGWASVRWARWAPT